MKKMTLKLDRSELHTLLQLVKHSVELLDERNTSHNALKPLEKIIFSLLRDSMLPVFMRKILIWRKKYTVSLKEFEAEALSVGLMMHQIYVSDPYKIALIEKVKSTPVI